MMSWNPFSRHTAPKKNVVSRTAERELEKEVKKVERLEETSRKLYKDTKRWVESNQGVIASEHKITQNLLSSQLCQMEPQLGAQITDWDRSLDKQELYMKELNTTVQRAVLEPMKKFNSIFPSIQTAVKKREQSLQEYNKCQSKVEKYQGRDRTGQNVIKMESSRKSLQSAKDEFETQNSALTEDLPKMIDGRVDYFQPSLEALIKSQVTYNSEIYRMCTELSDQLSSQGSEKCTRENRASKIQQSLDSIKALSITLDE
ncbi:bridging integrator 3-like isoform X2 [Mizuhopecten yessoensis]|uniref:Bridging integrator 3 n=1 Tax=Mizuhopecten yessoensis TaxID=6573 RepID=A0A210PPC7_MIZYE|nr:bridging integrator 3-like isoform X2 [Mizuhopecten yessoensis]OWF38328.1 Bridging integrator 3 [Mizuhopecten yessoensis]